MAQMTELSSLFLFVLRGCSYHIYQRMIMQVTVSIGDKGKIAAGSSSQWQFTQTGPWERKCFIRIHSLLYQNSFIAFCPPGDVLFWSRSVFPRGITRPLTSLGFLQGPVSVSGRVLRD